MESLRNTLGITVSFDPQEVVSRIAAVHVLAEKIQTETQRWLSRPVNRTRISDALWTARNAMFGTDTTPGLTPKPGGVTGKMRRNHQPLAANSTTTAAMHTEEKDSLERTADSLTPELVRLRMMTENTA